MNTNLYNTSEKQVQQSDGTRMVTHIHVATHINFYFPSMLVYQDMYRKRRIVITTDSLLFQIQMSEHNSLLKMTNLFLL